MLTCIEIMECWREICKIYSEEVYWNGHGMTCNGDSFNAKLIACKYADHVPETLAAVAMYYSEVAQDGRISYRTLEWAKSFNLPADLYSYENLSKAAHSPEIRRLKQDDGFKFDSDWCGHIHTAHVDSMIYYYINYIKRKEAS